MGFTHQQLIEVLSYAMVITVGINAQEMFVIISLDSLNLRTWFWFSALCFYRSINVLFTAS
jgi:hypothetical protein